MTALAHVEAAALAASAAVLRANATMVRAFGASVIADELDGLADTLALAAEAPAEGVRRRLYLVEEATA